MIELDEGVQKAVRHFWLTLDKQSKKQGAALGQRDAGMCTAVALSFYASKEQAITAFNTMLARQQNFWKTVGDQLATGQLSCGDGIALGVGNDGHFSFFESASSDFPSGRFTVIERLR